MRHLAAALRKLATRRIAQWLLRADACNCACTWADVTDEPRETDR